MSPVSPSQVQNLIKNNTQSRAWLPIQQEIFGSDPAFSFVDVTRPSLARADAMMGHQTGSHDCLHPCIPGTPDMWVDLFYLKWLQDKRFQ